MLIKKKLQLKRKHQKIDITITEEFEDKVEWRSSDPTIATVENGVVTAIKPGEVTITITVAGFEIN